MPHKKIIFLDIDGVVLPDRANFLPNQTKPHMKVFDPCAVSLLNRACHFKRWKIVIHSSWLKYWDIASNPGADTVKDWCIGQGIKKGHFHEDSKCLSSLSWRYDRVDEWLARHPEVTRYWVLDDVAPSEDWKRREHWIKCNPDEGITMEIYRFLATH